MRNKKIFNCNFKFNRNPNLVEEIKKLTSNNINNDENIEEIKNKLNEDHGIDIQGNLEIRMNEE